MLNPEQIAAAIDKWLKDMPHVEDYEAMGMKAGSELRVYRFNADYYHERCQTEIVVGEVYTTKPESIALCYTCFQFWLSGEEAIYKGNFLKADRRDKKEPKQSGDRYIVEMAVSRNGGSQCQTESQAAK